MWPVTCWLLAGLLAGVRAQPIAYYTVPDAILEALKPKGFRASIPDEPGVELFAFHGNLNKKMNPLEGGQLSRDVLTVTNGRWVFEDTRLRLKLGDTINYWLYVQSDGLGYRKDNQSWTVTEFVRDGDEPVRPVDPSTPVNPSCVKSSTTVNGRQTCNGELLLDASFPSINRSLWAYDIRISDQPDYEFAVFDKREENCYVNGDVLHIKPTLLDKSFIETGTLNLEGCTGSGVECRKTALGSDILPPVYSARLRTRDSFSFKYGRVQVRAKLPCGDWLFPELWLEPKENAYGSQFYQSGQIRLAMSRGNYKLLQGSSDIGSRRLEMGCVLGLGLKKVQHIMQESSNGEVRWCEDFHNYNINWAPDGITFEVDNDVLGRITAPNGGFDQLKAFSREPNVPWTRGTTMAPFDKEFYLSIGVGVGGLRDFPDDCTSVQKGGNSLVKPWRNTASQPKQTFHNNKDEWYPTWDGEESALKVSHVKVWAL